MNEQMDDRDIARRLCGICAGVIAVFGVCASLYLLMAPASMFASLSPVLAALALALTNLLCMPLVYGYWVLAFRPKGGRTVLILQGIALVGFLVWYGFMLV